MTSDSASSAMSWRRRLRRRVPRAVAAPAALVALVALVAGVGCQANQTATTTAPASPAATPLAAPAPPRHSAAVRPPHRDALLASGALPDLARTPSATNAAVTQANIRQTICRTGYTKTIRPSSSYTTALKKQQLASGYAVHGDTLTGDYEEDHLISLELGGAPTAARNLWPESYAAAQGARVKDRVENQLHDLVCSGAVSLRTARHAIATNWWAAYQTYGGESAPRTWYGSYVATSSAAPASTRSTASTSGPAGATAQCNDGTYSYSQHRSGTCSHHHGVARWINPPPS